MDAPAQAEDDRVDPITTADGQPLPSLALGTSSIGSIDPTGVFGWRERQRAFRLLDEVFDAGCRTLDMARSYRAGGTERVVGEWLRHTGVRDELFLITKGGHPLPLVAPDRLDAVSLQRDLEATLSSLGTDRVDMYMLHRDRDDADLDRLGVVLSSLRDAGKTRFTGVSNWTFDRIRELEAASTRSVVHASSPQFSLAEWRSSPWAGCHSISGRKRRYERRKYARAELPTFAYCPLGQGFLSSGSHGGRFTRNPFAQRLNVERRARAEELAKRRGASCAAIALAYLVSHPFPVYPVVGVSSGRNMRENLRALEIALSVDEIRWLESGWDVAAHAESATT